MDNRRIPLDGHPESGNGVAGSVSISDERGVLGDLLTAIGTQPPSAEQDPKSPGRWEPQALRPRHREIMRRLLEGATYVEIAEDLGITPQSIMLVATSRMFREALQKMESQLDYQVQKRAEDLSNEALDKLKVLMRKARSQALQMSCADKILGIAGYSKIEKKLVGVVSGEEVIRELNKRRREAFERTNGNTGQGTSSSTAEEPARISIGS